MATRSRIGLQLPDGTIRSIYTHWDGYPRHHGPILLKHYSSFNKVKELIDLGNLSVLAPEIGVEQDFDAPRALGTPRTMCLAYGRDRHEVDQAALMSENVATLEDLADYCGAEYIYLFREKWSYTKTDQPGPLIWYPLR